MPKLTFSEETKKKAKPSSFAFFLSIWDDLPNVVEKALLANFCKCRLSGVQIGQLSLQTCNELSEIRIA
jgi:hypothetical protein